MAKPIRLTSKTQSGAKVARDKVASHDDMSALVKEATGKTGPQAFFQPGKPEAALVKRASSRVTASCKAK